MAHIQHITTRDCAHVNLSKSEQAAHQGDYIESLLLRRAQIEGHDWTCIYGDETNQVWMIDGDHERFAYWIKKATKNCRLKRKLAS